LTNGALKIILPSISIVFIGSKRRILPNQPHTNAKEVKQAMKKLISLLLSVVFVGSLMVVLSGCSSKTEVSVQAPAVEQTPATMGGPEALTPGAAPAAPATTPAAAE
jgi:hypothetical protein